MLYLDKDTKDFINDVPTRKNDYISFLEETIREIAAIIYYQSSLRDQDRWLNGVMQDELFNPEDE